MLLSAGSVAVVKMLIEHNTDADAACDAGPPVMRAFVMIRRCLDLLMSADVVYGAVRWLQAVWLW